MMIYEPTESEIFHYGGARHSHLYNRQDPSLCGSITRGIGYRNLAGRMAAMGGANIKYITRGLIDYWEGYVIDETENHWASIYGYKSLILPFGGACISKIFKGIYTSNVTQQNPIFYTDRIYDSDEIKTVEIFFQIPSFVSKEAFGFSASALINGGNTYNICPFIPIRTQVKHGAADPFYNVINLNDVNIEHTKQSNVWYGEYVYPPITLTVVRNGNNYTGYVNGVQRGSNSFIASSANLSILNLKGFEIERKIRCFCNSIRLYNVALTYEEIEHNRIVDYLKGWDIQV